MTIQEQVKIMETQMQVFDKLVEKLAYIRMFIIPDPEFTQEAIDIVFNKLNKGLC